MKTASRIYLVAILIAAPLAHPQSNSTVVVRDPQAIAFLTQAVKAIGGISSVSAVHDFTGTGTVTYSWAGKSVDGAATVRGMGPALFRFDAQLAEGTRSWLVDDSHGTTKKTNGTSTPIQYANAVNMGSITFPYPRMVAALANPAYSISLVGTETLNDRQGEVIEVQHVFPATEDPTGDETKYDKKKYVIDSQTFALLETKDTLWSEDGRMRPVLHEVLFSNFTAVNGLTAPFSILEKVGGQQTWSLQLSSISFNSGLTAATFQF
jgi:hypothetical protein